MVRTGLPLDTKNPSEVFLHVKRAHTVSQVAAVYPYLEMEMNAVILSLGFAGKARVARLADMLAPRHAGSLFNGALDPGKVIVRCDHAVAVVNPHLATAEGTPHEGAGMRPEIGRAPGPFGNIGRRVIMIGADNYPVVGGENGSVSRNRERVIGIVGMVRVQVKAGVSASAIGAGRIRIIVIIGRKVRVSYGEAQAFETLVVKRNFCSPDIGLDLGYCGDSVGQRVGGYVNTKGACINAYKIFGTPGNAYGCEIEPVAVKELELEAGKGAGIVFPSRIYNDRREETFQAEVY